MRRSYDPSYGSREQLRNCHEHGMKVARERDALKTENAKLQEQITELKAIIAYMTEGE
jgi:cbb3-type cytochrome oxidase cytochrome c subunit